MDTTLFKLALIFLCAAALIPGICSKGCDSNEFKCLGSSKCLRKHSFCNGFQNCDDGSDEKYCNNFKTRYHGGCPYNWWKCHDGRCIPPYWRCNSDTECFDNSDEEGCTYEAENYFRKNNKKKVLTTWFLRRLKKDDMANKKSHELYRTAIALYLSDERYFAPGNKTGEEVASEVKLQLLTSLTSERNLKRNELALSIHALMVTCNDPRDFYGFDLVSELRAHVQLSRPIDLLALCNARDAMTPQDAQRAAESFNSKLRPFTIDNQALALQALACIQSRTNFTLEGTNMTILEQELKWLQFENGTVGNLRTTALVLQALIATQSYQVDFNFEAAMKVILAGQKWDGSFGSLLDSYYVMPLLSGASLLNISSSHCRRPTKNESGNSSGNQGKRQETIRVIYLIWIGEEEDQIAKKTLYVPVDSSFYDVIEIVNILDANQKVQYNVVDGKPYLSSVNEVQEDMERGLYWYTYLQSMYMDRMIMEESPVDVKIRENYELTLWYK